MGTQLKTTIEISDPLLQQAKRLAAQQNITLRELVELGLRRVISEQRQAKTAFSLRKASFKGNRKFSSYLSPQG